MRLLFTRTVAPARREHYGDGNSGSRIGEETCEEQVAGDASALISRCESPRIEHSGQQGRPARGSVRTSRRLHRRTGAPTTPSPISPDASTRSCGDGCSTTVRTTRGKTGPSTHPQMSAQGIPPITGRSPPDAPDRYLWRLVPADS